MANASPLEHLDALVEEYHEDPYLSDEDAATLVEADIDEKWEPGDQDSLASWSRRNAIKWRLRKMRGGKRITEPTPAPEMVATAPQARPQAPEPMPEVAEHRPMPASAAEVPEMVTGMPQAPPKPPAPEMVAGHQATPAAPDTERLRAMRTKMPKPVKRTGMDRPRQRRRQR